MITLAAQSSVEVGRRSATTKVFKSLFHIDAGYFRLFDKLLRAAKFRSRKSPHHISEFLDEALATAMPR